jgi:hypothetical protein
MTEVNAGHTHAQKGSQEVDANAAKNPDTAAGIPSQEQASRGGQAGGSDVAARTAADAHKTPHPAHTQLDTNAGVSQGAGAAAGPGAVAGDRGFDPQGKPHEAGPTGATAEGETINRPSDPSRKGSDTASPAPATSGEGAGNAQNQTLTHPQIVRAGQPGAVAADLRAPGDHGANQAGLAALPPAGAQSNDGTVDAGLDPMELANLNAGIADTKTQRRALHAAQVRSTTRTQALPDREYATAYEAWLVGKIRSLQGYQQSLVNQLSQLGVATPDEPYYEDFRDEPFMARYEHKTV